MIRIVRPAVVTSVQDQGRFGFMSQGHSRSGAMDSASLALTNRLAGTAPGAAGIEFGPGGLAIEITASGVIAFGGARRDGVPWWQTLEVASGDRFDLSPPRDGMWSYLAIHGGIDTPVVMGSRSVQVREGIGRWIGPGDEFKTGAEIATPSAVEPPSMTGAVRLYGDLPGRWIVGTRLDRMGYQLEGPSLPPGLSDEWSEPLLPGCIQITPSGVPIVLMAEGPTVGGYTMAGQVHSQDLRLVAQSRPGITIEFISTLQDERT